MRKYVGLLLFLSFAYSFAADVSHIFPDQIVFVGQYGLPETQLPQNIRVVGYIYNPSGDVSINDALNVDSGVLYVDASNDRVGIGTTSPGAKLHVVGDILGTNIFYAGTSGSDGDFIARDANNYNRVHIDGGDGSPVDGNVRVFITGNGDSWFNSGNVGIGTTSPTQKLEVAGNVNISTNKLYFGDVLLKTGIASGYLALRNIADTSYASIQGSTGAFYSNVWTPKVNYDSTITIQTSGTNQHIILSPSGNVGIGTTSPSKKLHVNGDVQIESNLYMTDGTIYDADNLETNNIYDPEDGTLQVSDSLKVTGQIVGTTGAFLKSGGSYDELFLWQDDNGGACGDTHIGIGFNTYQTADETWYSSDPCCSHNAITMDNSGIHIRTMGADGSCGPDTPLSQAPPTRVFISTNGNVGIGVTSPSEKLDINGDVLIRGNDIKGNSGSGSLTFWTYQDFEFKRYSGGTGGPPHIGVWDDTNSHYVRIWHSGTNPQLQTDTGDFQFNQPIQASSFKDKDNTGYYLDPSSTGTSLKVAGDIACTNCITLGTETTGNYLASVSAGGGISVSGTPGEGWTATISHKDTSSQASVDNSGNTFIQDITLDTYGHVTGITSATVSESDPQVSTTTSGRICYGTGSAVTCNDDLYWDSVNNYLGVRDTTPSYPLDVNGKIRATGQIESDTSIYVNLKGKSGSTGRDAIFVDISSDNDRAALICNRDGTGTCSGFFIWSSDAGKQGSLRASYVEADCPSGYTQVGNSDFCIENYEHGTATWYDAVEACANAGAHLCTLAEWVAADQIVDSPPYDMNDDDEWVADPCSAGATYRTILDYYGGSVHVGCALEGSTYAYRCCVYRRIGKS